ncbi:MAG: hypothetical protein CO094_04975 [Anaerolineae bacterium CG_4_9_14_3_um_filter_57_17]|nr:response regulator [bacterium]NCT21768.1 response regulator [bacterium]PJB67177.1 MAG: hypothetical protein CO094_04975 [Anaerolineae bacterium CG_4_9_14_3_um_filter_57_17]
MKKTSKKTVHVRVIKQLAIGLSVEADDGSRGLVRAREISWDENRRANWKKKYPIGWKGQATIITLDNSQTIEFSIRLAEKDPWDDLASRIHNEKIFVGIVGGVVGYGAFIEIAPGISGLLHRSQLPVWFKGDPLNLFWPGDKVKVTVRAIDYGQRRISLSLPFSQVPEEDKNLRNVSSMSSMKDSGCPLPSITSNLTEFIRKGTAKKHILVVEDEPEQRVALSNWLRKIGQRVEVAENSEKALALLQKTQPDIAIIDIGLPKINGAQLAEMILDQWPKVRVISTTDWARADEMMEMLEKLQARGVELLIKPLLPEDIIHLLENQGKGFLSPLPNNVEENRAELTLSEVSASNESQKIKALLQQFRLLLGFEQVILFTFDSAQRSVSILEQSGGTQFGKKVISSLIFSPVRDVAESRQAIFVNEISPLYEERFRYLLEFIPTMKSCIGVPVFVQTTASYALFAIDAKPHQISNEQRAYATAMALAISSVLEQYIFQEKAILMQRAALIGQLTRALVHEINNLIAPLASRLGNLQEKLSLLEKSPHPLDLQEQRNHLVESELIEFQTYIRKIIGTTRMFGHIAAKEKNEILRVDKIIEETLFLLRDTSNRLHVTFLFTPPDEFVVIRNQGAALEQVLLNIMLNAIQQISELRPDIGGWVRISLQSRPSNSTSLRILVEDNGPGIHVSLWEKIFDVGFTTRRDGSGIGLYISRSLMEQMGGKVYIQDSQVLGGTTFAVEVPC